MTDKEVATYSGQTSAPVNSLVFSYTVQPGDNVADLQAMAFNALPNGTTIQDGAGNPLDASGFKPLDTGVQIDTTPPTLGTESFASPSGTDIGVGKAVTFTLAASEAVDTTASTLTLNNGRTAAYASGSGTAALTYSYTVAAGDDTGDLEATALNGVVTDNAGNPLADGTFKPIDTKVQVDTVAPTVSSPSLTVAQNSGPTPVGIAAPTDAGASSLAIAAGALPSDGTVTLADGMPVASGQALSVADLTGLLFTPNHGAYDASSAFTYAVMDGAGNSATGTATLTVGTPGAPAITGTVAGQTTSREAPVRPFASATVSDPNAGATDVVTITLAGGGGTLADGPGQGGLTRTGADSYSLAAGTPAAATAELEALVFTPTAGAPSQPNTTRFTLTDASNAGTGASDAATTVTDTAAQTDAVSISASVTYVDSAFTLTGSASSTAGPRSVEISAVVDGAREDLGAATLNPDGSFTFQDAAGDQQSFFQATLTDGAGGTAISADPGFNLTGGLGPRGDQGQQEGFSPTEQVSSTLFQANGTRRVGVDAPGQAVEIQPYDTVFNHRQGGTTFVYEPGGETGALDVIRGFKAGGPDHDVLNLNGADFDNSIADVLRHTGDIDGSAFVTDPVTGDAIRLAGVGAAELKRKDVAFHG